MLVGRRRTVLAALVVAMLAAVGVVGALVLPSPGDAHADQVRAVAGSLRCPSCMGEDVADSASPLAESMRLVVAEQLAAGRTPGEVREWFARAYGDEVLLDPPRRGLGWLLWAAPLAVVALAVPLLWRRPGRRAAPAAALAGVAVLAGWWLVTDVRGSVGPAGGTAAAASAEAGSGAAAASDGAGPGELGALTVLQAAVQEQPGRTELREALASRLEEAGRTAEAAEQRAAVVRLRPLDADARYRYAAALVRDGSADQATEVLEQTLEVRTRHAPTLALLGTLLRDTDPGRSAELMGQYAQVREEGS
ncbi:hypothetical protein DNL40_09870 [Xylanimonas oleitrophica]|uniref:Cytochrome c-type biogenesis protein n=1 Tax=Xylanimonas oleitrophica TaxID=2607479 RepID=A0A2W5WP60_9MICO|nr:hypothetical protein DNL40_09870 [Xylanimonas oleitrophica]